MTAAREYVRTAREYLRVSIDRSGIERSNAEQQADNRAAWDFDFGPHYSDATSASRYARKGRDDWDRLIDDLETGTFGADVLVLWEGSRGSRKVAEWVALLDLCEARTVGIAVTEYERIYDPANPRDRKELIDAANDAEYESAKTSRRVLRGSRSRALAGRPHGPVLFGYRRVYDPDSGALLGQQPAEAQAAIVRRIFTEYASGRSARAIALGLNEDGITTGHGRPWVPLKIHRTITNVGYIARRVHRGEDFAPADWEPLVGDELFALCARRREAASWRRGSAVTSLLSGLGRCGVCGGRMAVKHANSRAYYGCQVSYCSFRLVDRLDTFVTAVLLERLSRPDVADALDGDHGEDPRVVEARRQLKELRTELDDAMQLWRGEVPGQRLSAQAYAQMESHLLPRIAETERTIRSAEAASLPLNVDIPAADQLADWWVGDLDAEQRRAVLAAYIVSVTIQPVGRGCRSFEDADFTVIEWRR